jgi:lysyl-tRNA synthetase, class II
MADKAEQFKKQNAGEKEPEMREVDGQKQYLDEETKEWVSKNELKKRQTLRKKAKDAAEKAAKKAQTAPKATAEKKVKAEEEEVDPSKYTDNRKAFLEGMRSDGKNPYPHKFNRDFTIPQFKEKYDQIKIANGEFKEGENVSVTGRIMMLRPSGAKLIFIDLVEDTGKV